jgi:uncharacterized membrane protein YsdA (DUF1294 family)
MDNIKYILIYLLIVNIISFALFFIDKQKAKKDKWRIKESTLHIVGFMGGIIGSIAAMALFHHKTKKAKFVIITIIALLFNLFLAYELIINSFDAGSFVIK